MIRASFYHKEKDFYCKIKDDSNHKKEIKISENIDLVDFSLINIYSDKKSKSTSYFENELIFYYYIEYVNKLESLLKEINIQEVNFSAYSIESLMAYSYFRKHNYSIKTSLSFKVIMLFNSINSFFKSNLKLFISYLYLSFILLLNLKGSKYRSFEKNKRFAFIHCKPSLNKIYNVYKNSINYYYDSITLNLEKKNNLFSFYSVLSFKDRLDFFLEGFFEIFKEYLKLKKSSREIFNIVGVNNIADHFSVRISHFILIKYCFSKIIDSSTSDIFFSGEKESRYGKLCMDLRDKKKILAIGLPHGLAYSYKYPHGIFGDKYFCYNQVEADFLNNQYGVKKFLFDKDIVVKMFKVEKGSKLKGKQFVDQIVFFPEPRRININYKIIEGLLKENIKFKIKLHPKDAKNNYLEFGDSLCFIENFNQAISKNICLARKSTVLLEALYNQSKAIAILEDREDKFFYEKIFPSLNTAEIDKAYSFRELLFKLTNLV